MSTHWKIRSCFFGILVLALAGCGGGSTSGPAMNGAAGSAGVNFTLQLKATHANATSTAKATATKSDGTASEDSADTHDDAGTPITLTEVRANVRQVEFYLPENTRCEDLQFTFVDPVSCDPSGDVQDSSSGDTSQEMENENETENEDKIVVAGPFIADLIKGTSTPSLTNFLIPAGNYVRIDVRLDQSRAEDGLLASDDPLLGWTLLAGGTFDFEGATHAFRIRMKSTDEIRFEDPAGIAVQATGANDVVMTLDEQSWFKGIDLANCLKEGHLAFQSDGSLLIDQGGGDGGCGDVAGTIQDNIEHSGNVTEDDQAGEDQKPEDSPHPEATGAPEDGPNHM